MSEAVSTRLAEKIVNQLFTNGAGTKADRLELKESLPEGKGERGLGGWCWEAAYDQVRDILIKEPNPKPVVGRSDDN